MAGLQVPLMPLLEVAGKPTLPPEQMAGTCVKTGVVALFTVTVMVALVAHCPAVGVNV